MSLLHVSKVVFTLLISIVISYGVTTKVVYADAINQYDQNLTTVLRTNGLTFSDLSFKPNRDSKLYLILFNEYVSKSQANAVKGLAAITGFRERDMQRFIEQGDTSFLSNPEGDQSNFQQEYQNLIETYQSEMSLFQSLAYLESQTLALELFSNGSTRDSEFDLIDDLKQIEKILFKETRPSQFGEKINLDFSSASSLARTDFGTAGGFAPIVSPDSAEDPAEGDDEDSEPEDDLETVENALGFENACPADPSLQTALSNFENEDTGSSESNRSYFTQGGGIDPSRTTSGDKVAAGLPPTRQPLVKTDPRCANADQIFGDLFCLTFEENYTTVESYYVDESSSINESIKKLAGLSNDLVSESLIPKKVTGNFGEPNFCKGAVLNAFIFQLNLIPKPAAPEFELVDVLTETSPLQIQQQTAFTPQLTDTAEILENTQTQVDSLIGVSDIAAQANEIIQSENSSTINANFASATLDTNSQFVNDIYQRLTVLNQYFNGFADSLTSISNSLQELKNKPKCAYL